MQVYDRGRQAASRQRLRSESRTYQLIVPRRRRTSFTGRRTFSDCAGVIAWNWRLDYLYVIRRFALVTLLDIFVCIVR